MDVEFIRAIALKLPAAVEEIKWGNDLVFSVGKKMFCVCSLEPPINCSFKVTDEEFEELSTTDGFLPAPYMARAKWVQVSKPDRLNKQEWTQYINQSYELVKAKLSKKEKIALGLSN
jgi:predicted DNA-binding protein (MmcQ/YjbR family)